MMATAVVARGKPEDTCAHARGGRHVAVVGDVDAEVIG